MNTETEILDIELANKIGISVCVLDTNKLPKKCPYKLEQLMMDGDKG